MRSERDGRGAPLDASIEALRRDSEASWSELRERRVLRALLDRAGAPTPTPTRGPVPEATRRAPGAPWSRAGAWALAAAGVAAIVVVAARPGPSEPAPPSPPAPRAAAAPGRAGGELWLADGSRLVLGAGARLRVVTEEPALVRVRQEAGVVTYRVAAVPGRAFVVDALGTAVRVRGTVFDVEVHPAFVEVRVAEGAVEVTHDARVARLEGGELLRVRRPGPAAGAAPPSRLETPPAAAAVPERVAPAPAPRRRPPPRAAAPGRATAEQEAPVDPMAAAEVARRAHRLDEAAQLLAAAEQEATETARRATAALMLARVEISRGRPAAAARAFDRCVAAEPDGALAEGALAGAAEAWLAAGRRDEAVARAARHGARWPESVHAAAMRGIADR